MSTSNDELVHAFEAEKQILNFKNKICVLTTIFMCLTWDWEEMALEIVR